MAALREKPRICRYELVVPVLFSHLRNADAASERRRWLRSKSSLGSHMLAHACAQLSSESRVVFAWRSKRVTRNEPLFLVSKKRLESPLTPLDPSLCDLWKIHHVPRALPLFFSPPSAPFSRSRLFYSPLWILARRFCILLQVRRDRVLRSGRMVYTWNSPGGARVCNRIYVSPLGKISSAKGSVVSQINIALY